MSPIPPNGDNRELPFTPLLETDLRTIDASRFLQQSNARLSFHQPDEPQRQQRDSRQPLDRRRISNSRYVQRPSGASYVQQGPSASQTRFPFASRLARREQQAPLFYSATDELHEDEGDEHEKEVADFYALQRSRQHLGRSHLTESSELEDDGIERVEGQRHDRDASRNRGRTLTTRVPYPRKHEPETSAPSSTGKGRLEEVNLASTLHEEAPESLAGVASEVDSAEAPSPFQPFRSPSKHGRPSSFISAEPEEEANMAMPQTPSPGRESLPPTVIIPSQEPPKHDMLWANLFQISLFAMLAAFVLVWFHTSAPSSKKPLGDTIYSALRGSTNLLLWDTVISIVVALVWLALLRHHVRTLVYLMLFAVPVVLVAFSLYPLISSFNGSYHGKSVQDKAMRWLSFVPTVLAAFWSYQIVQNRHSLAKGISILEFSTKILSASPYLVLLGFATLAVVVAFTWTWMLMFERIFLSGHFSATGAKRWILDVNSWWLGAFFILQYLWSLGVIAGVQRATTAATVSQWYFHRLAVPQPTSRQVVQASLAHANGALFGTVCLSTLLSLLVRLPLIILPGRLSDVVHMCAYWMIPTSLATLTNPLTLTYAAVHSHPLGISARGLGQLSFISRANPSTTLGAGPLHQLHRSPASMLVPYRLAKLLLHATRFVMSFALGFGGWVRTARSLTVSGAAAGIRGSLYAYIVGLIAGTIGYAVLGTIENVVGAVLDAAVICWASETGGNGEARFCREAGELFGDEGVYDRRHRDRA